MVLISISIIGGIRTPIMHDKVFLTMHAEPRRLDLIASLMVMFTEVNDARNHFVSLNCCHILSSFA